MAAFFIIGVESDLRSIDGSRRENCLRVDWLSVQRKKLAFNFEVQGLIVGLDIGLKKRYVGADWVCDPSEIEREYNLQTHYSRHPPASHSVATKCPWRGTRPDRSSSEGCRLRNGRAKWMRDSFASIETHDFFEPRPG